MQSDLNLSLIPRCRAVRVAGPDTHAHVYTAPVGSVMSGLRFAPGAAPLVLGAPADAFTDRQVPLDDVWAPGRVRALADRIASASDAADALEAEVLRIAAANAPPAPTAFVAERLRAGAGVDPLALELGVSRRQLHRRCLASFGYRPKLLARILRMNDALALARGGVAFVDVAARSGYADQAHLSNDVRDLAGVTLRQLV